MKLLNTAQYLMHLFLTAFSSIVDQIQHLHSISNTKTHTKPMSKHKYWLSLHEDDMQQDLLHTDNKTKVIIHSSWFRSLPHTCIQTVQSTLYTHRGAEEKIRYIGKFKWHNCNLLAGHFRVILMCKLHCMTGFVCCVGGWVHQNQCTKLATYQINAIKCRQYR